MPGNEVDQSRVSDEAPLQLRMVPLKGAMFIANPKSPGPEPLPSPLTQPHTYAGLVLSEGVVSLTSSNLGTLRCRSHGLTVAETQKELKVGKTHSEATLRKMRTSSMAAAITKALVRGIDLGPSPFEKLPTDITDLQLRVGAGVTLGLSNIQIGRALYVSPHTVKTHVDSLFEAFGVRKREQVARGMIEGAFLVPTSIHPASDIKRYTPDTLLYLQRSGEWQ